MDPGLQPLPAACRSPAGRAQGALDQLRPSDYEGSRWCREVARYFEAGDRRLRKRRANATDF